MVWSSQAVLAAIIVVEGDNGGVFMYDSAGNLIDSMAFLPNVDPQTDSNLAGITNYQPTSSPPEAIQMFGSQLSFLTGASSTGPWTQIGLLGIRPLGSGSQGLEILGNGLLVGTAARGAKLILPPSGDTTGAADVANMGNALIGGFAVELLPGGVYYINQPINVPNYGVLVSDTRTMAEPSGNYGAGGLALGGAVIHMTSGFSGAAGITFVGTGSQGGGQVLKGITIDGTNLPGGSTAGGLLSTGFIAGVTLRDVLLFGGANSGNGLEIINDGTPGHNGDFWDVSHCKSSGWGGIGIHAVGMADSYWTDVESTGNTGKNWLIENCANSRWLGCKGENSNANIDWEFQDDAGFSGTLIFIGCTSAQSVSTHGRNFTGTGTGTYIFRGCNFPNGTVYPANLTTIINDDLPPVFDLVTGSTNAVVEQIIGTYTIPANYLNQPNAQMRFHLWGRSVAGLNGDTLRLRVRANTVGGNILLDFGSITCVTGTQRFSIDGVIGVDGAGAGGQIDTNAILNSTIAGSPPSLIAASTGSVNVPLNASVAFCVTALQNDLASFTETLGGTLILDAAL